MIDYEWGWKIVASELNLREGAANQWVEGRGGIFQIAPCEQRPFGERRASGDS